MSENTVFDTTWPQKPKQGEIAEVAAAAVALRTLRREGMAAHGWSLRELYRTLNLDLAAKEKAGEKITPRGLPLAEKDRAAFITQDCVGIAGQ